MVEAVTEVEAMATNKMSEQQMEFLQKEAQNAADTLMNCTDAELVTLFDDELRGSVAAMGVTLLALMKNWNAEQVAMATAYTMMRQLRALQTAARMARIEASQPETIQ